MEFKRNSPLALAIAVALITIAVLFLLSTKAQVKSSYTAPASPSNTSYVSNASVIAQKKALFQEAPELQGISGYINAPQGFRLADVRGKVVLIDFWTYSCINCIRTLPYLEAWDQKYRDQGLVIIGVQSPEFDFEKDFGNVQSAVQKFGIKYPVVLDNDHATWNAYGNLYWPHDYLIDADGFIRSDHIGEGGYSDTEAEIQKLLAERNASLQMDGIVAGNVSTPPVDFGSIGTPEIYLGYQFARGPIGNPEGFQGGKTVSYTLPPANQPDIVSFEGNWTNNPDNMELASDTGKIVLNFQARNVNIVAGGNSSVSILLDGAVPPATSLGSDAALVNGSAVADVDGQRLYSLLYKPDYSRQTITIEAKGKGFRIYTFTFG
jgi:thiol-disulfide isomerase/thioredoxin